MSGIRRSKLSIFFTAVMFGVPLMETAGQKPLPGDSLTRMRRYTEFFLKGEIDSVWAHINESGRRAIPSRERVVELNALFRQQAGVEVELLEERFVWRGPARQYWRTMRTSLGPEPAVLRWVIGADGEIAGVGLNPLSAVPPADSGGPVIKAARGG